jgi:hypothetical protein
MDDCEGTIYFVGPNVPPRTFSGWSTEDLGTPKSGGADFVLLVEDSEFDPQTNPTSVANWVVTFIPRGDPTKTPGSPFSNDSSIAGSGAQMSGKDFVLDLKDAKIQKRGAKYSWDWTLAIQIVLADGSTTVCFVSDPQMDVDQLKLSKEELDALLNLIATPTKPKAKRVKLAKKKGGKHR